MDHFETVRQRKDGSLVDISLTVSPLKDAEGKVVGASKIARDITERKQAQARNELLTHEIQHRTKNLFAVVQAVVARSFAGKQTVKEAESAVVDRLRSLAQTHVMLIDKEWQGADLAEVVRTEMSPYCDRVQVEGPDLLLTAEGCSKFCIGAARSLRLTAAKYGALSNATGRVRHQLVHFEAERLSPFRLSLAGAGRAARITAGAQRLRKCSARAGHALSISTVPPRVDFALEGVNYVSSRDRWKV